MMVEEASLVLWVGGPNFA